MDHNAVVPPGCEPRHLAQRFRLAQQRLGIPSATGDQASTCCEYRSKVQQWSRYSAMLSGVRLHPASLSEFQRESGRHFASKGLGVRVPWLHYLPLSEALSLARNPSHKSTAASTATVSGNGLVQLTKAYDSGLEFSAGGVRSGRRSQPQDKMPPRPCIVCGPLRPGDLPPVALGVAYERGTPAPRPVARGGHRSRTGGDGRIECALDLIPGTRGAG
jgi:hypothetical protein